MSGRVLLCIAKLQQDGKPQGPIVGVRDRHYTLSSVGDGNDRGFLGWPATLRDALETYVDAHGHPQVFELYFVARGNHEERE